MKLHSISLAGTWLLRVAVSVLAGHAFKPLKADASISSVTVNRSGRFQGAHGYTHAEITIHGSVPRADGTVGHYSVPAVIIYPRHRRGNGVGVVDWLNSAFYHFFPPTTEDGTIEFTRRATGNYLFEEGYTYLSIQWNKKVTHIFGPAPIDDGRPHNHLLYGTIERSADAWEILLDAARFLKDPDAYQGKGGPARVATVLSSGYSQGGAAQLELLAEGLDPDRIYDGHLIQMIGLTCWKRNDLDEHFGFFGPCKPLPTTGDHAPVIVLASETDMVVYPLLGLGESAFFLRNQSNPSWRQYEMAGISHLPAPIFPVNRSEQNTADARPVFRAAFANLTAWAHGTYRVKPPASRHFDGSVDATGAFIAIPDPDGHFAGGVRLPHVRSMVHGYTAGAPLGLHRPLNFPEPGDPSDPFVLIGGTFTRFEDAELRDRYPSRDEYVSRVFLAASSLVLKRYITFEDWEALIAAAKDEPLPCCPEDDDGNDLHRHVRRARSR